MSGPHSNSRGFTLIELIIVMVIMVVVAAVVLPHLGSFSQGRTVVNASNSLLEYARYAQAESILNGKVYRLNVDPTSDSYWLTMDMGAGNFEPVSGNHSERVKLPAGLRLDVQVNPQPAVLYNVSINQTTGVATQQQQTEIAPATLIDGTSQGTPGQIVYNVHGDGSYFEFQPTGRCDPGTITLTDQLGKKVLITSSSASEMLHIPLAGATR